MTLINPLFNNIQYDENEEIHNVFILIYTGNENIDSSIYKLYIQKDILNNISKNLIIYKINKTILSNSFHKNNIIILSDIVLQQYNIFNYSLDNKNIVLPIFNISYNNIILYLQQYEILNTFDNIYKILTLNKYFNTNTNNYYITKFLNDKLSNFYESQYWENCIYCNTNLTLIFKKRKLNLLNFKNIKLDYLFDINKYINNNNDFSKINCNYKLINNCNYTNEEINIIYDILNDKQKYLLICNLLISKKFGHLVLNNYELLIKTKNMFNKYAYLFRYLIGYTWTSFYFEESIKKSNIKKTDHFIFTLNTACELPYFPFMMQNPKLNPYMSILIHDNELKSAQNLGGIVDYTNNTQNPLCNLDEFLYRLNIFNTGNSEHDIFYNVDWDKDKIALSGSIMTACIQKSHPLMNLFDNYKFLHERINRYFLEYYSESDVDVMFLTQNIFDFIDKVNRFYHQIVINICNYSSYAEPSHTKLINEKQLYIYLSKKIIEQEISKYNISYITVINSLDDPTVKLLFKDLIEEEIKKYKLNLLSKFDEEIINQYPDHFNFDNISYTIRLMNYKNDIDIDIKTNHKYKIISPHINHNLELFMVKNNDFFGTVHTFHLPCVRSYYDGNNVYLTPSCISAHLTYMNLEYKYFAGSQDPIDIINKYRMRGFGTWLNKNELKLYSKYTIQKPFWTLLYESNTDILGQLNINHKLFQPRLYNIEHFYNTIPVDLDTGYSIKSLKSFNTIDEYFNEIAIRFKTNNYIQINFINSLQTINVDGSINPVQKWVIEAIYNILEYKK